MEYFVYYQEPSIDGNFRLPSLLKKEKKHDYNFKNASLISLQNTHGFVLVLKRNDVQYYTTLRLIWFSYLLKKDW